MKIKSKLFIIMISLVTISIIVPSVVALNTFTKSLETEITNELKTGALNAMDKLSRLMFERLADTKYLTDPRNMVTSSTYNNNFTTAEKVEHLRQIESAIKAYASISIYDQHGIKIGDTRSLSLGVNNSDEPFYKNAIEMEEGNIYYDQVPTFSKSLQQYVIHFSGPLYDAKNNQTSGVLVLTFPLNKINDIMLEAGSTISGDVDISLLSNDGLLIYSNNDQKSVLKKKVTDLEIIDKIRDSNERAEVAIGPNDNASGSGSIGGTGEIIFIGAKEPGFLDYRGNNWSAILAVDTGDAFESVTTLRNQFIIIAVIILVIAIALIIIFARSISRPLIKLRDITNEVSLGNFDTKIETQKGGGDELAHLSSSFENMRQKVVAKTNEILKANEELRQKDRLKDEFINIAAHELRTPIQPILGLSQVLRDRIKRDNPALLNPEIDQILDIIIKDAKRLTRLAQRILDVTRIESQDFDLKLQKFDIVSALSGFISDFKKQVVRDRRDRQDLDIVFEFDGIRSGSDGSTNNEIYVIADRDRLIQVISNLLSNAVKFTKSGTISVQINVNPRNKEELIIGIKDTGVGINPTILPKLFTKFSSESTEGIGLGLYISKKIVQAHGGKIWAENNVDGKGATFFFTLRIS